MSKGGPSPEEIRKHLEKIKGEYAILKTRRELSWELLVQIRAQLLSSPSYRYARELLGIHKNTWYRWKQKGDDIFNSLQEEEIEFDSLDDHSKMCLTFVYYLSIAKPKMVKKAWKKMSKLANTDYRALQFQLKVLDPDTFNVEREDAPIPGADSSIQLYLPDNGRDSKS